MTIPAGTAHAEHPLEEAGVHPLGVRLEGEEERRDADREPAEQREVDRLQRVVEGDHPDEDRQDHRVHGLGQEQAGDALDVVDHPPALGDHRGQRREVGVEQHQLGDATGRLAAGGHRHAAVGVLQGEHVVDAVAGHRHGVPAVLQGADHRPLLVRRDPAEHRVLLERVGERLEVVVAGQRAWRRRCGPSPARPARLATAPTVTGLSPEMTLTVTPCSAK